MSEPIPNYERIAQPAPLGELTAVEREIIDLLSGHRGKERAIAMAALADLVGLSTRTLQMRIKHLIEAHGVLIGSATGEPHGYYLITDPEEVRASVGQLEHRLKSLAVRISRIKKVSVEDVFGQMRMEL